MFNYERVGLYYERILKQNQENEFKKPFFQFFATLENFFVLFSVPCILQIKEKHLRLTRRWGQRQQQWVRKLQSLTKLEAMPSN